MTTIKRPFLDLYGYHEVENLLKNGDVDAACQRIRLLHPDLWLNCAFDQRSQEFVVQGNVKNNGEHFTKRAKSESDAKVGCLKEIICYEQLLYSVYKTCVELNISVANRDALHKLRNKMGGFTSSDTQRIAVLEKIFLDK